jgi:hypothetical protein
MDFSSDVLIDFGLNLAGFLVVALLLYTLIGKKSARGKTPVAAFQPRPVAIPAAPVTLPPPTVKQPAGRDPEFVPLSARNSAASAEVERHRPAIAAVVDDGPRRGLSVSRQQNRRAIYEEARRLLAGGKSRGELLSQLPVTEGELDMLTVAGKA